MDHDSPPKERHCQICGRGEAEVELINGGIVRPHIVDIIKREHPDWSSQGFICIDDLNKFRHDQVRSILEVEKGELTDLERQVVQSLTTHEILSSDVDKEFEAELTYGERLSDRLAAFGGSWNFLIIFGCVLALWIGLNLVLLLVWKPFDPYPYILLNLILSCLAAIQAPIIMMSQNRLEAKDRLRAAHDYQVNLKAELEIRNLHQKIDHLLSRQWERLIEIQEIQIELMQEMRSQRRQ